STTAAAERLCPRWMTSAPARCSRRRITLMAASWPSNSEPAVTMRIGEGSDALATTRGLTARRTGVQPRSGPRGVGGEPRPRLGYIAGHAFDDFVGSALDDDVDPRRQIGRASCRETAEIADVAQAPQHQ